MTEPDSSGRAAPALRIEVADMTRPGAGAPAPRAGAHDREDTR